MMLALALFYLLGVVGVGGGDLSRNWSDESVLGDQLVSAVRIGAAWPALVMELVSGT